MAKIIKDLGEVKTVLEVGIGEATTLSGVMQNLQKSIKYYGFDLMKGERPMHGKLSKINHHGNGLFCNLPQSFQVTRYHSLVLCGSGKESNIQIDGWTDDQVIMAISDEKEGVYGVQFHPESVTTQYGHEMLQQFMKICENWRKNNEAISKTLSEYIPVIEIFKKMKEKEQVGFLDSSLVGERGNYSILGMRPYHSIWKKDGVLWINGEQSMLDFEVYFSKYLNSNKKIKEHDVPFSDGAIGYFSYDYGRERMNVQTRHEKEDWDIPEAMWIFYDILIIEDCKRRTTTIICQGQTGEPEWMINDLLKQWKEQSDRFDLAETNDRSEVSQGAVRANYTEKKYCEAIQKLIQLIVEGEVYIVNMTQMLEFSNLVSPKNFFLELRDANPSSFGGFFDYGEFQIVCASPERFIR